MVLLVGRDNYRLNTHQSCQLVNFLRFFGDTCKYLHTCFLLAYKLTGEETKGKLNAQRYLVCL